MGPCQITEVHRCQVAREVYCLLELNMLLPERYVLSYSGVSTVEKGNSRNGQARRGSGRYEAINPCMSSLR
jgi:hypothetical protein